jgi:hypothetical protein
MTDTMCCPLSGGDGDYPSEFFDQKVVTARKPHKCYECGGDIEKGHKYERTSGKWDGRMEVYCTCLLCKEIRDHFSCSEGYILGELWEQLQEYFYPDMKAGGPCMEGLSPQAKDKLFTDRLRWLGVLDEN